MTVLKQCGSKGCKTSPRCEHPWWLDVMYKGRRHRMPVNAFALARGGDHLVTSRQEARGKWEPVFIAEVVSGHDPRLGPKEVVRPIETSIGQYIDRYISKYVNLSPLRSRRSKYSACRALKRVIGNLPAVELETPRPAEEVRTYFEGRALSTVNRYLSELRCLTNWGLGQGALARSPFHKFGVRISTRDEVQRDRRVSEEEEARLLAACDRLDERKEGARRLSWEGVRIIRQRVAAGESQSSIAKEYKLASGTVSEIVTQKIWREDAPQPTHYGREMRDRVIGAIETCCRKGELLLIQNMHVDWRNGWIDIPKAHAKGKQSRVVPFRGNDRLTEILARRRFLGPEAFVFGEWDTGTYVADFRRAWESVLLIANATRPVYGGRHRKLTDACCRKLADIDLHFHDLRHEGLSRYGEGGMLLRELQTLAGHANPQTTVRYEHVDRARLVDAMARAREERAARHSTCVAPPIGTHSDRRV